MSNENAMRRVMADMGKASMEARRKKYAAKREPAAPPAVADEVIESSSMTPEELEQILAGAK